MIIWLCSKKNPQLSTITREYSIYKNNLYILIDFVLEQQKKNHMNWRKKN